MGAIASDFWKVTPVGAGGAALFPPATALADNVANPTTTVVGAFLHGWDATGSLWDRLQVNNSSNGNLAVAIRSTTNTANVSGLGDGEAGVTVLSVGNRGSRFSDGDSLFDRERSWTGTHGTPWNSATTGLGLGAGAVSTSLDLKLYRTVAVFGNASAATTITVQFSQNNTNFYDGQSITLGGAGDFALSFDFGARYLRLKTSAAATIMATVSGKGI